MDSSDAQSRSRYINGINFLAYIFTGRGKK